MSGANPGSSAPGPDTLDEPLPAIDLATFILSLSHSAHVHFGDAPDPASGGTSHNLLLAKQSIDLLCLLQEKTRGNLTGEEESLLEQTIYELRHRLADAVEKKPPSA